MKNQYHKHVGNNKGEDMNNLEQKLLTVVEASEILRVASNSIRIWISRGDIIPQNIIVRLGRRVLFDHKRLLDWIDDGCKPATIGPKRKQLMFISLLKDHYFLLNLLNTKKEEVKLSFALMQKAKINLS